MCGILGTTSGEISRIALNRLRHRGPDSFGVWRDQNVHMGHTRLSIIDLKNGDQPFVDKREKTVLIFNGEIYNYREIRRELIRDFSYPFETDSDTEVLLALYECVGIDKALSMINGMFAFCIYDANKNKIYIARDRMGIKPVFYHNNSKGLTFCSEIDPIARHIGIENLSISPSALSIYFNLYYIPSPFTIWEEIKALEPGCIATYEINTKKLDIRKYWEIPIYENRDLDDISIIDETLRDSTLIRMRSDVPYGAYLSGGIDSSLIVKHMSSYEDQIRTFTAEIDDEFLNEKKYAEIVSKRFNTDHENLKVTSDNIKISYLRELTRSFGQPFADSSILPTSLISEKIGERVVVALGGDGADELFCGYDKYGRSGSLESKFYRNLDLSFLKDGFRVKTLPEIMSLIPDLEYDEMETLRHLDIRIFLEGDILQKIDRLSMRSSLEVRVPFLDHRIVDLSSKLSKDLIFNPKIRKKALKDILLLEFNKSFVHRPKVGFMVYMQKWSNRFDDYLNNCQFLNDTFFNLDIKKINDGYLRFAILMFSLWYEEYYV